MQKNEMHRLEALLRGQSPGGDRRGEFAVDISGNFRLIFVPEHNPVPRKDDKSIDCIKVTDIQILGTEDYH